MKKRKEYASEVERQKYVNMLSTVYDNSMETVHVAGKEILKPTVCIKYKQDNMPGVNLMDQITSSASFVRKGVKKILQKIVFQTHRNVPTNLPR